MENTSGLQPRGRAVLVMEYKPERQNSLIEVPDFVQERSAAVETRATVVECGAGCWPDEPPRAVAGEKVLISKMAGYIARGTADGKLYRFINDRDIFAAITKEAS